MTFILCGLSNHVLIKVKYIVYTSFCLRYGVTNGCRGEKGETSHTLALRTNSLEVIHWDICT